MLGKFAKGIRSWWRGKYMVPSLGEIFGEEEPKDRFVKPWLARTTIAIGAFWCKHWKFLTTTTIGLIGLYIAMIQLVWKDGGTTHQQMQGSPQSIQVGRDLNVTVPGGSKSAVALVARFPFDLQLARARQRIRYLADEYLHKDRISLVEVTGPYGDNILDSPDLYNWDKVIAELERQGFLKIVNRDLGNIEFEVTRKKEN